MKFSLLSIALVCFGLSTAPGVEPEFDTLIPYPRELAPAGELLSLEGFRILTGPSAKARIGAAEINHRIEALGGDPLPVESLGDRVPEGNLIIIATCTAPLAALKALPGKPVTAQKPGAQGYVIRAERLEDGYSRLWLLGSDPLGALYAAVTARQLIQP
ncbi:MAG: hypothetical protein ACC661_09880, partial [Verrucomicrobiales bacterium]